MDGTHVCVKVPPKLQGMSWNRHDNASLNIMAICDLNMLFTYIWNGAPGSCHDTAVLTIAQESDPEFPLPPMEKYYVVDSGYPNRQGFLAPYKSSQTTLSDIICHSSTMVPLHGIKKNYLIDIMRLYVRLSRELLEFGRKKWRILCDFPRYSINIQREWSWLQWDCIIL
ncbi:unnamed protein product [Brassica napus]|uniref:(rape) hypothetical protein n=1 Tax=Brassica napus TaxID=3708 RepID=A0A816Y470_BRANA|nr:unnamed protein product [Brassica napus]